MYSNIRSRAGLVALVFALIISLVSAVPIPIHSGHSSALPQRDLIQHDTGRLARALTGDNTPVVPRGLSTKIEAVHVESGVEKVAREVGSGAKQAAQKFGDFVKTSGTKIAKHELKVLSATQGVAAKTLNPTGHKKASGT